jgi:hypothetical protein
MSVHTRQTLQRGRSFSKTSGSRCTGSSAIRPDFANKTFGVFRQIGAQLRQRGIEAIKPLLVAGKLLLQLAEAARRFVRQIVK